MGVSPMLMSIKTIGLVVVAGVDEDIGVDRTKREHAKLRPNGFHLGANVAGHHPPRAN